MQETVEALGQHAFLRGLSTPHLEKLAGCAQQITLTADQFLGREKEAATTWYLIQSGRVAIEVRRSGPTPVRVLVLGPGDIVGWSWLVPPHRWQFDVRVLDSVQALALDADALRTLCDSDHELGYQILKRLIVVVSGRLSATQKQVLALTA
jgi:CRP-like cAMP-binding protein